MNNASELTAEQRAALTKGLKAVMGDTYALYVKTHGYHWNVTGPRFKSLHELFMAQYTELWTALDEIAERIRSIGEFAPGSTEAILENASIKPDNSRPDAEAMVHDDYHYVRHLIDTLPNREQVILRARFSLEEDRDHPSTLHEIGLDLGVSRERIRQLQNHALESLRHRWEYTFESTGEAAA